MKRLIFFFFLAFVLLSCGSETAAPPNPPPSNSTQVQFVDATAQTGIDFIHISGSAEQRYILETMSAGAAFFDYDNDGHLDLFVVNGTRVEGAPPQAGNRLYHNNGDGTFDDATVSAGLQRTGWGMGCAVGTLELLSPRPSWPSPFLPQPKRVPMRVRMHVWYWPHATCAASALPGSATRRSP